MSKPFSRRAIVSWFGALAALPASRLVAQTLSSAAAARTVNIESFSAGGKSTGVEALPKIVKGDAQWQAQLTPAAFRVARREGTEMPYSGEYAQSKGDGLYRCICCDTALFDSRAKFESGTGWPSFYQPLSVRNVAISRDASIGMVRDAVSCRRCDAHLGHVFDDGPAPTGLRYCLNSVSLHFAARN